MAPSKTTVRNIPRGEEIHTSDPFGGNDNNRRVHERRLKAEAQIKASDVALSEPAKAEEKPAKPVVEPVAAVPVPAPAAPAWKP